ncbi:MAG: HAMP domain-containing protein [Anaerolineales bacterium]|nr:HAMP domain-containing protein [Chloroflexota bacterium]MBL6980504.1 HAMP domain-containing protein [Anaerolineales bacterium]
MATKGTLNMGERLSDLVFSVPVRIKITGIMLLPVAILGLALNYWIQTGLSDWLSYILTDERVQNAMQAGSRSVSWVTALSALASILLTSLLMLSLTKPLLELRQVAQRVADGDFASRARVWVQDEIGEVARSINLMIDRLVSSQEKLERSNKRLEAINQVALAAGRELDLQDVLDASLNSTLEVFGLESGWIYMRDPTNPGGENFQLASAVSLSPKLHSEITDNGRDLCICQREILSKESGIEAQIHECERLKRLVEKPEQEIFHITIPLETRAERFGLINLVSSDDSKPSENDIDTLTTIGAQVSEFVANAWLHASLKEKEAARQVLLTALVNAQENEQARLARELHDDAGQSLTSLLIRLKTLEKHATSDDLRDSVAELCTTTSETIEKVRGVSHRLRPAALEELGLEVALRTLAEEMLADIGASVDCQFQLEGRRLPFEIETNLYRITQEGLTNVLRHARASIVLIELVALPGQIAVQIKDDGIGFSTKEMNGKENQQRLGLISMQERAEMLGGSLEVTSAPGEGTSLQVRIPFDIGGKSK